MKVWGWGVKRSWLLFRISVSGKEEWTGKQEKQDKMK